MNALTALASTVFAVLPCVVTPENQSKSSLIQIWRLEKLSEAESVDSPEVEVSSLPRFLIVTDRMVFDLLYIDREGGYTAIHEKVVKSRTSSGTKQTLLISDLKNGEKFALQFYPSKGLGNLETTLTARKANSVFARVARCDYRVASDSDSIHKLKLMLTHDKVKDHKVLNMIVEAFLDRAQKTEEPCDQPGLSKDN